MLTIRICYFALALWVGVVACQSASEQSAEESESSTMAESTATVDTAAVDTAAVDTATGLALDKDLPIVVGNCTGCHSAQLITQNRATREGWQSIIVWMQKNHRLWDLGENEAVILDYLEEHYAPEAVGRRKNLQDIEWYDLEGAS